MSKKGKEKIKIDFVCERCGKKQEPDKKGQQKNGHFLIAMKDVNVAENL